MTIAHFIMQGKGGVGKSLIAGILYQYLLRQGLEVSGCDTDPVNSSLARHKSLDIKVIDIMDGEDIDPGRFDTLIEHVDSRPPQSHLVVDIGASCFVSLCAYLKNNAAFEVLHEQGHTVYIHTVITGGVNLIETLNNFSSLAHHFDVPIVVWLNHFFGNIGSEKEGFKSFKVYQEVRDAVVGIIDMPKPRNTLFEGSVSVAIEPPHPERWPYYCYERPSR